MKGLSKGRYDETFAGEDGLFGAFDICQSKKNEHLVCSPIYGTTQV